MKRPIKPSKGRKPAILITWKGKPYTAPELSPLLGISKKLIYKFKQDGKLKSYMHNRLELGLPKLGENPVFFKHKNKSYRLAELAALLGLTHKQTAVLRYEGKLAKYLSSQTER
jgi:DNA-binding Xre family transcriptional regulator